MIALERWTPQPEPRLVESRPAELVELLLLAGYVDGQLHPGERAALERYLAPALDRPPGQRQLDALFRRLDAELAALSEEIVHRDRGDFVATRLMVRAVGLFAGFTPAERQTAIGLLRAVMQADGAITPAEQRLHDELMAHLTAAPAPAVAPRRAGSPITVLPPVWNPLKAMSHPLLDALEHGYSPHPVERASQVERDHLLIGSAMAAWQRLRERGAARLAGITDLAQLPPGSSGLDGFVHYLRPDRPVELVVLGDLHGCYGCLKAALLQSDFIRRVWAHQWDPLNYPDVKLVLLGDYIDRGRFSFDGVLRTVLQLLVAMPEHVIVLRGNHEHFVSSGGEVRSLVYPAEALPSIAPFVPPSLLEAYRVLFEAMPTSFVFDRTLFVHGGIPRDDTFAARYQDLSSMSDPELRFQMMWSDPSPTEHVPVALQRRNPRFSFGRQQLRGFLQRLGCQVLVRGHEVVEHGFDVTDLGDVALINVFSAGGADSRDLPLDSHYRRVTPMAMTMHHAHGDTVATPWPIHYQPFNHEICNGLHRPLPQLPLRHG